MRLTNYLFNSLVNKRPFYVTTPIFYVNAAPHIGHLYSAIVADAIQRFEKLVDTNCNVFFTTGTDEHGTKIQQAAANSKLSLPDYCSKVSNEYKSLFDDFHVDYTDFVRTTEDRHKKAVHHFWNELKKNDCIYKSQYSGWYSVNDETFVPETQLKEEIRDGKKVKVSVESGHKVDWTEETNYMFRLSEFKSYILEWLQSDPVIKPVRFQTHMLEWLNNQAYFPDISVSRPASRVHWAIPVPGDDSQRIYVWLDALVNYLTSIGYPDNEAMASRGRPWPADVHVIGKDILKFHCIYWPAFLMAIKLHPPRQIVCHSHWTVDGVKMSKSLGNVVNPRDSIVGLEGLRYLLLREGTMHSDANFSETKLLNTVNAELADTLGNLASRCCGAALNPRAELPPLHAAEFQALRASRAGDMLDRLDSLPDTCQEFYRNYQFYKVVDAVMQVLHSTNEFFEHQKPWELKKKVESQKELDVVLHVTMETLRICGIILQPIIPNLSCKLLDKLEIDVNRRSWQDCEKPSWRIEGAILEPKKIKAGKFVLFQRIYVDKKQKVSLKSK